MSLKLGQVKAKHLSENSFWHVNTMPFITAMLNVFSDQEQYLDFSNNAERIAATKESITAC